MKTRLGAFLMAWALISSAAAHELEVNRATLVSRDRQHLMLTFFVDYPRVLHQVLASQRPVNEFVLTYSAMEPQAFQSQLLAAQRQLQAGIGVKLRNNQSVTLVQWAWPQAADVQAAMQKRAMQLVVAGADRSHAHAAPMEIRAQASASKADDFAFITLKLPPQFQQVLVVSYQPKQVWVKPGTSSPEIAF